jgi:adenylate cyclase
MILMLLSALLIFVGSLTILINYYTDTKILLDLTKKIVGLSGTFIERRVTSFLQPVRDTTLFGVNVIKDKVIDVNNREKFKDFLLELIKGQPQFAAIYWGDPEGDFFDVERKNGDTFYYWDQRCNRGICRDVSYVIDLHGNKIADVAPELKLRKYDPTQRPWYQKVIKYKKFTISDLYLFFHTPGFGITASMPVYAEKGELQGVFSVDLRMGTLSDFISQMKISKNTSAFIFDSNNNLVAAPNLDKIYLSTVPKISDIKDDWIKESHRLYEINKTPVFIYRYNDLRYFAFFKDLTPLTGNNWTMAIVFPLDDIMEPLSIILKASFFVVLITFIIGIVFTWIISGAMSRPIVRLAKEAMTIKTLDFSSYTQLKTNIKEIFDMQDAFNSMKQSLQSFVRYVPFNLVKNLMAAGGIAHVGGESKKITTLFVDIQGFTSLSEKMAAQDLMSYLSEYFEAMSKVIIDYGGTIDKYIGDAVMAFWGAPLDDALHAFHACQTALEMMVALEHLNGSLLERSKPAISVRIGINTGFAVVGNVGSNDRLSYTAMGDSVNVGSRLQDINKIYKSEILVSAGTYELVKHFFHFRLLDHVAVRGKKEGIYVYQMLLPRDPLIDGLDVYNAEFKQAFDCYQRGEWDASINLFQKMIMSYPNDGLIRLFLERCICFKNNPPAGWQGIWRLD